MVKPFSQLENTLGNMHKGRSTTSALQGSRKRHDTWPLSQHKPPQMAGIESFGATGESWHLVHDAAHDLWCDRLRSENIPQSAQHAALSIFLLQDIKPIYLPTCQTCEGDGSERGAQEELSANLTFPIPHQAACRSENCKNSRLCLNCGMSE